MTLAAELVVLLALVLANGVLAGSEIAVLTLRPTRVRELVATGRPTARVLARLRKHPERFLSTVQIGITVVGATAGAFGGVAFADDLRPWIERSEALAPWSRQIALALAVGLVSYLSIVLGELVPKSLALRASERYALLLAVPLEALSWIVRPAVYVLSGSSNAVLRIFGDRTSFTESRLSADELRALVDEAGEEGTLDDDASEIASRALGLADLDAADVMVHRRFMVSLPVDAPPQQVRETFLGRGHQRIPVHDGSIDHLLGYVSWRDVVARLLEGGSLDLGSMLRPCHFVPETKSAPTLLEELRSNRLHMAIVVDEHGGTAGLVTLEDVLEELVGDITGEHGPKLQDLILREGEHSAVVLGTAQVRDVNRALDLDLAEPPGWSTMAGLAVHLADGRIPASGERFTTAAGIGVEVLDASPRRVRRVRVHLSAPDAPGAA